jgi:hypothetical protein
MKKLILLLTGFFVVSCSSSAEEEPASVIKYTLTTTANPSTGGTVTPASGQHSEDATVNITANPAGEYLFSSWTGATGTTATTSVVMNSNKTVTANFVKKKYALTTTVEGEGTVSEKVIKAGASTDYNSGTIVELTATPKDGWGFKEWTGDLTGSENPKQITIDKAKAVKAVFEQITNVYLSGDIVQINPFVFYDRYLSVYGIKIVAAGEIGGQKAVPDKWIYKTAQVFKMLMDKNANGIDQNSQINLIKNLSGETGWHQGFSTGQRVAYGGGNEYSPNFLTDEGRKQYDGLEAFEDDLMLDDMVWYKNVDSKFTGDDDIVEILEHTLHTLHRFGVKGAVNGSTEELNIEEELGNVDGTELFLAMKEAYENSVFDIEGYGNDFNNKNAWPVMLKEYQYLLTFAMWEFSEFWDGGSLSPEWNDNSRTKDGLKSNNPLGFALYEKYFSPVISKPSKTVLRTMFKDNDEGDSGYVPD